MFYAMNNSLLRCVLLVLFLFSFSLFWAKDFKILDTSNGLPDNTVKTIVQDEQGFIWMGTFNGLCRYDGLEFTVFQREMSDYSTLLDNHVEALLSIGDTLWVGSLKGLNCYLPRKDRFYTCSYLTTSNATKNIVSPIRSIIKCGSKILVLTTEGRLFIRKSNLDFSVFDCGENIDCLAITPYRDDLFWAYTSNGLYLIDSLNSSVVRHYPLFNQQFNNCVLFYSQIDNTLYVGLGIGNVGKAFKVNADLSVSPVHSFNLMDIKSIVDYKDGVWFGTDGGGLIEAKDNTYKYYTPHNSNICSDAIHSLFVDREGCLWIGSYRGGISFYSSYNDWFHTLKTEEKTLTHNVVTAVYVEKDKVFVGLDGGGLNVYDKKTGKLIAFNQQNSNIAGNNVLAICGDQENLWMAIYEKGLCKFSRRTFTFRTYNLSMIYKAYDANQVWDLKMDSEGYIWILGKVVYVFDTKNETFKIVDGVHYASSIIFDDNVVWISSNRQGLYKLDKRTKRVITHYSERTAKQLLKSNSIRYMFMDSTHSLWLSSESSGLYKLDEKNDTLISYAERPEILGNKITCIEEDEQGYLWMGTYNGLYKYNPTDDSFVHFGKMDNLRVGQFNYHACAHDDEYIYMGSTKGLVWFRPLEIQFTHRASSAYFTRLELLNRLGEIYPLYGSGEQTVSLTYNRNFFTIRFSVPDMLTSDKIQASCFLKGFETEWQTVGTKRQVSYTNVPPGEYVFYVKTTDSSGRMNKKTSSLRIIITPPWWRTNWAWCLWILLASGGVIAIFSFYRHELNIKHLVRIKEMEKEAARNVNEEKLRFYTNITHELRTPIFLITAPLEELIAENKRVITLPKSDLMGIYRNAMKLNKLITRMIDLRKLEQGKLKLEMHCQNVVSFCRDLVPDYDSLCQQKNIIFYFLPAKTLIKLNFDAEKLEIILSNLVSNAFKYTPEGGRIVLAIDEMENEVVFSVEDNGIGIKKEFQEMVFDRFFQVDSSQTTSKGDGIGLSFVKYLVELHGGIVRVESEYGKGSKFIVSIPVIATDEINQSSIIVEEEPILQSKTDIVVKAPPSSPTATHTILLIDDEPGILELIERSLIEEFKVLKATNGMDGLSLLREFLPDLVVCDVMMPKLDGMEFLNLVKKDKSLSHIPVIMLTAKITEEDQMVAFDSGADAYLTKPISLKYLRKRIDHLLSRTESVSITNLLVKSEKNYSKEEQRFLLKCRETIEEHLMNPELGVVFLAEKLGMSHSSFYRKIKAVTGMSGMDFINEYRIFKAVQLFNEGETNVGSVCVKCGFNDIKSFRDAFKKKIQISPKQYVTSLSSKIDEGE